VADRGLEMESQRDKAEGLAREAKDRGRGCDPERAQGDQVERPDRGLPGPLQTDEYDREGDRGGGQKSGGRRVLRHALRGGQDHCRGGGMKQDPGQVGRPAHLLGSGQRLRAPERESGDRQLGQEQERPGGEGQDHRAEDRGGRRAQCDGQGVPGNRSAQPLRAERQPEQCDAQGHDRGAAQPLQDSRSDEERKRC
jgi:hypothetical protein